MTPPRLLALVVAVAQAAWTPLAEAKISQSGSQQLESGETGEGFPSSASANYRIWGSLGTPFSGLKISTSGRSFYYGVLGATFSKGRGITSTQLDITVLYAKTEAFGTTITPGAWQTDRDPIFLWEAPSAGLDVAGYSYALDAQPDETIDTTATSWNMAQDPVLSQLTDGKHVFSVKAINTAGNAGNPISIEVWVDTMPPTVSGSTPAPGTLLGSLSPTLSATVTEPHSGLDMTATELLVNGHAATASFDETSGVLTASGSGLVREGSNRVELRAIDRVGNAQTPLIWSFTVDATPPTGTLLINDGASLTASIYVTLNLTASDGIAGVDHMLLSNDAQSGYVQESFTTVRELWRLNAVRGTQKVYVKFVDKVGNVSQPVEAQIELVLTAPETIILSGPAGMTPDPGATFSFSCPEGGCLFSYAFDGGDWSDWTTATSAAAASLPFGNHYFKVKAAKESNGIDGIQSDEEDPTPAERTWIIGVESPVILLPQGSPIKLWRIE